MAVFAPPCSSGPVSGVMGRTAPRIFRLSKLTRTLRGMGTIGERIKAALADRHQTQATLAQAVGLSESAMSKALAGKRSLSSIEAALIAEHLGVTMHWLVTGEADPFEVRAAARHSYDGPTGTYSCDPSADLQVLEDIALVYRQAQPA